MIRILIVDDREENRYFLDTLLKGSGYEVESACHGAEALDKLKEVGKVDLALVDWNMPRMNGLEFIVAVRKDAALSGMRVMMVTTEAEVSQISRALDAGANEYVMKPFTSEVLRDKLGILGFSDGTHA